MEQKITVREPKSDINEKILKELKKIKETNLKIINMNRSVFDARGAADYLTIGYSTLLECTRIGKIERVKNGTNYIYKKEFLDRWLEENKRKVDIYK